jgi:hypothetical protein
MRQLFVRPVRPGQAATLTEWGRFLMGQHRAEVVASLAEENVSHESAYLVREGELELFVGLMESPGLILPANAHRKVNQDHVDVLRRCLRPPLPAETLYTFDA